MYHKLDRRLDAVINKIETSLLGYLEKQRTFHRINHQLWTWNKQSRGTLFWRDVIMSQNSKRVSFRMNFSQFTSSPSKHTPNNPKNDKVNSLMLLSYDSFTKKTILSKLIPYPRPVATKNTDSCYICCDHGCDHKFLFYYCFKKNLEILIIRYFLIKHCHTFIYIFERLSFCLSSYLLWDCLKSSFSNYKLAKGRFISFLLIYTPMSEMKRQN